MAKLYIVGIGPGSEADMTPSARVAIEKSDVIVGYKTYIDFLGTVAQNKRLISTGMRGEVERCRKAVETAVSGEIVSVISGGDAGIYGMAGLVLEIIKEFGADLDVEVIPGISAVNAAAALLGAPLVHDFAVISLSDLLTEWEVIEKRINCAAMADFVVAVYNPKSQGRVWQIEKLREIFLMYRDKETPVGIVRNACRDGQSVVITNLEEFTNYDIDMFSTVIIGKSDTFVFDKYMITPRGYEKG